MEVKVFSPHPALQHLVHNIMVAGHRIPLHVDLPVSPFPPLSQHALYFYAHQPIQSQFFGDNDFNTRPNCMLIGPQLKRVNVKIGHHHLMVRIGFQPGALHRLVKFPMYEILDYPCNGADVFGNIVNEIHEKLNEATDFVAIKNIIESFLRQLACREASPFTSAIKHLIVHNGNIPINELAWQAGLSTRQFERKCNDFLGFSPKLFSRIARFSKAYRLRQNIPNLSWTDIAYQCGYFDQMHFIRDFKEFAGVTPTFMAHELAQTPYRLQADLSF